MSGRQLSRTSRRHSDAGSSRKGPAGLIFMCNNLTKQECLRYKVFGLPVAKRDIVEQVTPGTLLFLFNLDRRELYGIYEAVSHGGMNLEPKAFQGGQGSYPAQVRFGTYRECLPLSEAIFRDAIKENYYAGNKFSIELTGGQVSRLVQLFCPIEPPRKRFDMGIVSEKVYQEERLRQDLVDRNARVRDRLEPSYLRDRLHPQVSVVERLAHHLPPPDAVGAGGAASLLPRKRPLTDLDRLPAGALERLELRPPPYLPQIRTLDGSAGLLEQGRIDEVDQLALKYLKRANPSVTESAPRTLDHYSRRPLVPQAGDLIRIGHAPVLAQDPLYSGPPLGVAHSLRDEDGVRLLSGANGALAPSLPRSLRSVMGLSRQASGPYAPLRRR